MNTNTTLPLGVITHRSYIVATSDGYWGTGKTLEVALDNAKVLNKQGKIKRGKTAVCGINLQTAEHVLTEECLDGTSQVSLHGYEAGDYMNPCVNGFGGFIFKGEMTTFELKG